MEDVRKDLTKWLHEQDMWVQLTAERILSVGRVTDQIISEALKSFMSEDGRKTGKVESLSSLNRASNSLSNIKLFSIGEINGIDDLSPRTPLQFGTECNVIYGLNGAGKSGYTRILKKASGVPGASNLISNVYKPDLEEKHCSFVIDVDSTKTNIKWVANSDAISYLKGVDIFDSSVGEIYLENERDATYLPLELSLLENLVKVFTSVKDALEVQKKSLTTKLPARPSIKCKYTNAMYEILKHDSDIEKMKGYFIFSQEDAETLKNIEERLKNSPLILAAQKRKKKELINRILSSLDKATKKVSEVSCETIYKAHCYYLERKKISLEGATALRNNSHLNGVGEETWKALWDAAKKYSTSIAYVGLNFPNIREDARCVLCQQVLDQDSKARFLGFEAFVSGKLEADVKKSHDSYKKILDELPSIPSSEELKNSILAAQLDDEKWFPILMDSWQQISKVVKLLKENPETKNKGLSDLIEEFKELQIYSAQLESEALVHDKESANFKREEVERELQDIKGKKWCSGYIEVMENEIHRLKKLFELENLLRSLDTRKISTKAGAISEKLVTEAYIERFNRELELLGAKKIKVELVKSKVQQGKVKHKVQLHGLSLDYKKVRSEDVLSEGERKIVSLASFLADVTAKPLKAPFVFDDPITSLDQFYEENTVKRLISLSKERQVIVFTHRLSMLGLFIDCGNPDCKYLRRESWGCGEHSDLPLRAKSPINAIKDLQNSRLPQARKALQESGEESYEILAKAICSEFRILLERIVEFDFLADVVSRHRREIQTKNKLSKLAKINEEDCDLINKFMTKYSSFEHSQSLEAPVCIIPPNELQKDFDEIIEWHKNFQAR